MRFLFRVDFHMNIALLLFLSRCCRFHSHPLTVTHSHEDENKKKKIKSLDFLPPRCLMLLGSLVQEIQGVEMTSELKFDIKLLTMPFYITFER